MIELLQRALEFFIEAIKFLMIALAICVVTVAAFFATMLRFALLALSEVLRFLSQIMRAVFCLALIVAVIAASAYTAVSIFDHYIGGVIEKSVLCGMAIVVPATWALNERRHPWGALTIAAGVIAGIGYAVSVLDIVAQALALVAMLAFVISAPKFQNLITERTPTNERADKDNGHLWNNDQDRDFSPNRLQDDRSHDEHATA
jgi:hypothetical protein